ncbi:TonB-dependent receptor [Thalassotalea insulae]|uniref:TonB-dependent receptor n=1 Tax=Thalassotalea insulae TaxID=2056778 RepID=A0ABQ6GSL7_9GAMM|nr:TonB-dependent receptor [Thalassotalea insulae]GLX78941.1 TonB-dependent receptor [Thalassotalea insulae]
MKHSKSIAEIKKSAITLAVMAACYAPWANSQQIEQVSDESKNKEQVEVIEITGSRIKRTEMEAVTSVISVSGEDITSSGSLNINDYLNKLPISVPDLGDTTSNFNGFAGMASQNLRGLGAERTLVLVNGKRHVPSFTGTTIVDVSSIPVPLIDRIEIMTGGASAIYGADAVAGVMNIILKKSFEGTEVKASFGQSNEQDGERTAFDITHGREVLGGNLVANFSYYKTKEILAKNRSYVDNDIAYLENPLDPDGTIDGVPDTTVQQYIRFWNQSDRNFFIDGKVYKQNSDGTISPTAMGPGGILGNASEGFFGAYTDGKGYYHGDYQYQRLSVPSEKFNVNLTYQKELANNVSLFLDGKYARSDSEQRWSPYAEYGGNYLPTDYPFYSSEQLNEVNRTGQGLEWAGYFPELGEGGADWSNSIYQIVGQLEGYINQDYYWSTSAQYGKAKSDVVNYGGIRQSNWDAAIGVWGTTCDSSCVPVNVFQPLTDEMLSYVSLPEHTDQSEIEQSLFTANISGPIFMLPAGELAFAAGIEYRDEKSRSIPSEISQSGVGTGNSVTLPVEGSYHVTEVYGELRVPLLSDQTFAKSLSIEGAVRYADYSTAGGNTSWNIGAEWQPIDDIKFRASLAQAVRAPNINEIFATESYGGQWVNDPCSPWGVDGSPTRTQNCATLGADSANIPYWTWATTNNSGNKALEPEEAKTTTIGAVISPRWIENLDLVFDYWDIDLSGEINSLGVNSIISSCVDSLSTDNVFCDYVSRNEQGQISLVETTQLNLSKHKVRGLDININYQYDFGSYGQVYLNTILSKLIERQLQSDQLSPPVEYVDSLAFPKWRANINLTYQYQDFSATLTNRYIDQQKTDINATAEDRHPLYTKAVVYTDLSVNYWLNKQLNFNLAINNLFDKETPQLPMANRGGASYHLGYTAGLFDTIGRFATVSMTYKF